MQDHIFSRLDAISYTDINTYNPANIGPPPFSYPPIKKPPVELILSQDCGGFNLGSFFIRRSPWTERLLDIWWDPVVYEQKHTEWEHNEQNALEYFYEKHPWIRHGVAFLPQRFINSFPPGACGDGGDPKIHYQEDDHDFVVNMAGCQLGRDCLDEMKRFSSQDTQLKVQKRCMDSIKGFFPQAIQARRGAGRLSKSRGDAVAVILSLRWSTIYNSTISLRTAFVNLAVGKVSLIHASFVYNILYH